jgi:hypothetical protein
VFFWFLLGVGVVGVGGVGVGVVVLLLLLLFKPEPSYVCIVAQSPLKMMDIACVSRRHGEVTVRWGEFTV